MPPPTTGPLTATDNRRINEGLARIAAVKEDLLRAQRCGLDVTDSLATLDALQYQLETVKKEFLPNLP